MHLFGESAAGRACLTALFIVILTWGGMVAIPPAAKAGGPPLHERCWPSAALAGRPVERFIRRQPWPAPRSRIPASVRPASAASPRGVIRRVSLPAGIKLVALTFDLCESRGEIAGYDGAVVDYLRRNKVRATFFAGGKWMANHDERIQQLIADPLFEVASHGWSHRNLRLATGRLLADEILGPAAAYGGAYLRLAARRCAQRVPRQLASVPRRIRLFRFPYGACNARALAAVADAGLTAIQWDVVTGDPWRAQSARAIAATVLRTARPGSIIVAHANGRGWHTAGALPAIVQGLRRRGYRFVTVSELIAAGRPVIARECYSMRPGDTVIYDRPLRPVRWRARRRRPSRQRRR